MKFAKWSRKESWHMCAVSKIPPDPAGIWEGLDDVDSVNLWARYRVSVRTKQANETQLCMNDTRNQYLLDDHSVNRPRGRRGGSHVGMAWTRPLPLFPSSPFPFCCMLFRVRQCSVPIQSANQSIRFLCNIIVTPLIRQHSWPRGLWPIALVLYACINSHVMHAHAPLELEYV